MTEEIPKYLQIVNWIKEQIELGKLLPGQKIYSENELSQMFGMSRQTVRHAVSVLEQEEILTSIRGSGTYIKAASENEPENKNRIAIIVTYLDSYIFPKTIRAIENAFFQTGYSLQIAFTNNLIDREGTILKDILEKDEVAGIIVEATKSALPNPNLHFYQELMKRKIPVLFINSYYQSLGIPHVSINDRQAGAMAARYLIEKGHKRITGIFKLDDGQGHLRYAGFLDALNESGITYDESRIIWVDTEDIKNIFAIRRKIEQRLKGHTALVSYNDEVTFELMKILKVGQIRVPQDLSIVSIDDSDLAVLGNVKITSIPYPMEALGDMAVKNLLEMIKNPKFDGNYEFDLYINERESVWNLT